MISCAVIGGPEITKRNTVDATASDEQSMAAYAAGDRGAFQQLFDRYAERMHGFFLRYFGSRALADDLLQATFLKLHAARASYRIGAPFRSWLYTIAARVRLDELRRRGRLTTSHSESELDEVFLTHGDAGLSMDDWLDGVERAQQVRAAMDALPEGQRIVVFLHRFEDLTFEEIAEILAMAPGAVRARAFRAYATLRATLKPLATERV